MVFLQDVNVAVQQLTDMQLLQNSLVFSEVIWIQFRRPVAVDTLRSHSVPAGKLFGYDQSTVQMRFVLSWCGWLPRTMMRWAEHGTVTRASVQLSIQYKKNSTEKEDACLQLHVVFDVQFSEVDCQNSLVSPERRISLQSKGGFRVDKPRNFTLVQGPHQHSQSDIQLIQLSWDPGGVNNSGLGASRISSGGACHGLGHQVGFQAGPRDGLPSNSRRDGRSE